MATSKKNEIGDERRAESDGTRSLDITIINASNLPLRWGRPPKPFVKIEAGGIKGKTKTAAEATTQPVWNESFPFVQLPPSSVVSLRVFHDGTLGNTFLCRAAIEIDELLKSSTDSSDVVLKLLPSATGGATLTVHAREAPRSDALDFFVEGLTKSLPSSSHPIIPAGARIDEFIESVSSHESIKAIVTVLETFVRAMDQVAKIHPIVNVAWKVVHALYQIPRNQLDRDDKVVRLITQIGDLYTTVRALEGTEKIKELESVIEAILQQTIECVLFIREYVGLGFGKRVLHQTISSTDAKIKEFEDALRDLKDSFRNRSLAHITLVTTRVSTSGKTQIANGGRFAQIGFGGENDGKSHVCECQIRPGH